MTQLPDNVPSNIEDPGSLLRPILSVGWVAKGLLYVVIGILAMEIARRGFAANDADQKGALASIASVTAGRIAVFVIGLGLVCYSLWQIWAAWRQDTSNPLDLARRIGWVGLALVYGLLAQTALSIAVKGGSNTSSQDGGPTTPSGLTVRLFELPAGRWIVIAIGLGTAVVGAYHLYKGWSGDHLDDLETDGLSYWQRRALRIAGIAGFSARALLLGIAGWLFIDAARTFDAERAAGIDESLHALARVSFGSLLLALTGIGLVAAGVYDMVTFRRQQLAD